ncbi:uncharacterized protein SPPG_06821 [Spizellomyces punctatus DAOM BR117]|uniref:Uncharacterized protein n=1 Tax=Spizellomyces punctatus (strain DAOM BR117) TaxID=645134 RepID=A0A0L0H8G8_SPIPD|nr:uncharacterized protein SPPG_06821 [Spizellomyces punctatus DAOM BR117]KNC97825.1 hypothetical protein SPPG_06821 [Spizellomyces punctatus DAOM BR117]|eukprot:XP_016605865.1 hypothetical protein SPPG_06821 [Spizellomyces punctatus DAOM BR117]
MSSIPPCVPSNIMRGAKSSSNLHSIPTPKSSSLFRRICDHTKKRYVRQSMDFPSPGDEAAFREVYIAAMGRHTYISMFMLFGFYIVGLVTDTSAATRIGWPPGFLMVRNTCTGIGLLLTFSVLCSYTFKSLHRFRPICLRILLFHWYFNGIVFVPCSDLLFSTTDLGITLPTPLVSPIDIIHALPNVIGTILTICCGFATIPLPFRYCFGCASVLVLMQIIIFMAVAHDESASLYYAASLISTFAMIRSGREMAYDRERIMRRMWLENILATDRSSVTSRGSEDQSAGQTGKESHGWHISTSGLLRHIMPRFMARDVEAEFQLYRTRKFLTSFTTELIGNALSTTIGAVLMHQDNSSVSSITKVSQGHLTLMMIWVSSVTAVTVLLLHVFRRRPLIAQVIVLLQATLITGLHLLIFRNTYEPQKTMDGMSLNYIVMAAVALTSPLTSTPVSFMFTVLLSPFYIAVVISMYVNSSDVRTLVNLGFIFAVIGLPVYTHDLEYGLRKHFEVLKEKHSSLRVDHLATDDQPVRSVQQAHL